MARSVRSVTMSPFRFRLRPPCHTRRAAQVLALLGGAAGSAACRAAPLSYIASAQGPAARPTMWLGWGLSAVCAAVCVIVAVLLFMALRRRREARPPTELGSRENGLSWLYVGTGLSVLALLGIVLAMLFVLREVAHPPRPAALTVAVRAYDWWWRAAYAAPDGGAPVVTANEIHIPVGVPVTIRLDSADVIHAFWVPALAGKTQAIPGQTNQQWLQADRPGVYRGQCTQYCGAQHAHMAFEVVAQSPQDFARWLAAQAAPAAPPADALTQRGQALFLANCAGCHTVRGTAARGMHAPDLTHLGSRRELAAGMFANTPQHLRDWIVHAPARKPGTSMPGFAFSAADLDALLAYLGTLR